ncbi:MAG: TonB-dependent receptor [Ginsengibacter sp.]
MIPSTKKIFVYLFTILAAYPAMSQSDSSMAKQLKEVVVTGQYKPQSLNKSVYQVRVISGESMELSGANNVQQVLNKQLGFRFSNDKTLGISDVKLNGMGGTNIKILLDGVPIVDRFDERVSLSQIDINNIERIEIVEGPMSVAYGSDAMAGVINIITKKNKKNTFSVNASAREETAGNEYYPFSYKGSHTQNAHINYSKNNWLIAVGGSHNEFDGFGGDTYGRGKSWRPKEQWLGNARIGYVSDRVHIYYRIDGLKEDIVARNLINLSNYKVVDQAYVTHRYIHQVQSEYLINDKVQLSSFIAYTDYKRQTETERRNFESNTIEPNQAGENDLSRLNSLAFKTTSQYQLSDKVSIQPGIDINHEKADGARISSSPEINDYAFFISSEIKPNARINVRPGLRFSSNSEYNAPLVIPSINTKFVLNSELDLRLAYGSGFRAPTLRELYLNFFDANHNLIGNKNLKAEYSNSVTGSLNFTPKALKNIGFSSTLSGYYSAYRNQIQLLESITNNTEYTYYNIDKSKTIGGRIENEVALKSLDLNVGFSYSGFSSSQFDDKKYVKESTKDMLWTPELNVNGTYRIKKIKTSLALFYKYIGTKPAFSFGSINNKDAILLTSTSSYQLADFTVNTDVNKMITASLGVKNIFDVSDIKNSTVITSNSEHSSNGPATIGYGRSFFLGLSFNWNHPNKPKIK